MRQQGKLTNWNDEKGFGFITPIAGDSRVFVHISAFPRSRRRPAVNDLVTYSATRDGQKRLRAERVLFQREGKPGAAWPRGLIAAFCLSGGFFALLSVLIAVGLAPLPALGFYVLMSIIALLMYGLDKSAAQRGAWRTAEATLHLVELAGGWPGALLAQRLFRHKTKKQPFQLVFWWAVGANCAALVWLLRADTAAGIRTSLGMG